MNEGWASYWHSTIMTTKTLDPSELVDYADHHSGTMATQPGRLNPYKLGIELFRDIEERWNKGQFGPEYEECDDYEKRRRWDKELGLGRQKIFEVRKIHNDVTFIDTFLTPDFCRRHKLFSFKHNDQNETYEIESREFKKIKERLLFGLTNFGQPIIRVKDGNYRNRGELYLHHEHFGVDLKLDHAAAPSLPPEPPLDRPRPEAVQVPQRRCPAWSSFRSIPKCSWLQVQLAAVPVVAVLDPDDRLAEVGQLEQQPILDLLELAALDLVGLVLVVVA